jgi:hypothetical protein
MKVVKIIVLLAVALTFFVGYQPKFLPFLGVARIEKFAREFNPKKASGEGLGICKVAEDIELDFPTRFTFAFRKMDLEYQKAIVLIILKVYRCHLEVGGIGYEFSDSFLSSFNPINRAYARISKVYGTEYKTTGDAFIWNVDNVKGTELGILRDEIRKLCNPSTRNQQYLKEGCQKLVHSGN